MIQVAVDGRIQDLQIKTWLSASRYEVTYRRRRWVLDTEAETLTSKAGKVVSGVRVIAQR